MVDINKNLVFVGKVNLDIYGVNSSIDKLEDTKDFATDGMGAALGGASMNVARAVKKLAGVYGDIQTAKIVTRMGQEPDKASFANHDEYILKKYVRAMTREKLDYEGINCTDVTVGQAGPGIATSIVSGYNGGRHILKQQPLFEVFNAANDGMISSVHAHVQNEVCNAGYVFIDPARPALPNIAADVCHDQGVSAVVDYGFKQWPSDAGKAARLSNILQKADILIVPGDAFVPGMKEGVKDPDALFEMLTGDGYSAKTVIMSDGMDPVRLSHNGKVTQIPVIPAERVINVNGAGDTRDGALMFYLSRHDDVEVAVEKATVLASIRIQYPDHEWETHIYDHVKDNPLFANDLPEMEKRMEMDEKQVTYLKPNAANDDDYDIISNG